MLQIRNWKVAARKTEGWRKEIGEAMARQGVEAPQKEEKNCNHRTTKLIILEK